MDQTQATNSNRILCQICNTTHFQSDQHWMKNTDNFMPEGFGGNENSCSCSEEKDKRLDEDNW